MEAKNRARHEEISSTTIAQPSVRFRVASEGADVCPRTLNSTGGHGPDTDTLPRNDGGEINMSLSGIVASLSAYVLRGDDFLRHPHDDLVAIALKRSVRCGLDPMMLARESISAFESLERWASRVRALWMAASGRLFTMMMFVALARIMLLGSVSEDAWSSWIVLDRLCGGGSVVGAALIGSWLAGVFRKVSWSRDKDVGLGRLFAEYAVLGSQGVACEQLAKSLKEIRFAELRRGVDGQDLRKRVFLQRILRESDDIERQLPRLGYIFIAVDLGGFVLGGLGFVLIPFLAWIQTASGA
jgi:hypothetical protein